LALLHEVKKKKSYVETRQSACLLPAHLRCSD